MGFFCVLTIKGSVFLVLSTNVDTFCISDILTSELKKGGCCCITHFLDIRIGLNLLPLYLTENISGVMVALGAASEAEIASAYASNIVRLISDVLKENNNTKVLDVNLTPIEKPPEDIIEPQNISEPEGTIDEIHVEKILSEIENYCFNIEAELGEVLNVVVNNPLISNSLSQSVDNSYKDVETVVREDLDCNFMIRYRDIYKNIKEMKEVN